MPGLIEYFEWAISLHKHDSDHKQVLACGNVINDYKWLRILKKFSRSYVYEWRGTPMLCPKSPHRLRLRCQYLSAVAVNICRLSLSISVGCRCQNLTLLLLCRRRCAVTAVNATNASTTSKTICDMRYAICDTAVNAVTAVKLLSLNVNIQKLKSVSHVPHGTMPCALKMDYKSTLESVTSCNC